MTDTPFIPDSAIGSLINAGICTRAYEYTESSQAVVIETTRPLKARLWQRLGLVWSRPERHESTSYGRTKIVYRLLVTKLVGITRQEFELCDQEAQAMRRLIDYVYDTPKSLEILYAHRNEFPIHKESIIFMYKNRYRVSWGLDTHMGNYLKCPVTGKIYAYDTFNFIRVGYDPYQEW